MGFQAGADVLRRRGVDSLLSRGQLVQRLLARLPLQCDSAREAFPEGRSAARVRRDPAPGDVRRGVGREGRGCGGRFSRGQPRLRQEDEERRAVVGFALDPDPAAMGLHDRPAHVQSDAHAAGIIRRAPAARELQTPVKQVGQHPTVDAAAVIPHGEAHQTVPVFAANLLKQDT